MASIYDRAWPAYWNRALQNYLDADHQLTFFATSERILTTEVETISQALGGESLNSVFPHCVLMLSLPMSGDEGQQRPHTFKSTSFSIPTQCGYCKVGT